MTIVTSCKNNKTKHNLLDQLLMIRFAILDNFIFQMFLVVFYAAIFVTKLSQALTEDGDIRLVNGDDLNQGRLEVFHNDEWGTVCDRFWSTTDGIVACRQLGLPSQEVLTRNAYFGPGSGPVWLSELKCHGTENEIADCDHDGWKRHDCSHEDDAGLVCSVGMCSKPGPLGLESKEVKDSQITSSSAFTSYEAHNARLNFFIYWAASNEDDYPWIQVDFLTAVPMTKVLIQGSGAVYYQAYVQEVLIQTGNSVAYLAYIKEDQDPKVFTANSDIDTIVTLPLLEDEEPITARYIRINPVKCNYYCALRFDVEGCLPVNECDSNNPCEAHATCTDLNDGYQCRCKHGYMGNGFQCTEIPTTTNNPTMETTQDMSIISISPKAVPKEKANTTMTNIGLIVGAAIGGIVLILLTLLLIWCICRYRRSSKTVVITETHNNELGVLDTHAQSLVGNIYNGINDQNTPRRDNTYAQPDQNDENLHDNTPRRDNTYAEPDRDNAELQDSNSHQSNLRRDNTYALIDQINSNLDDSNSHTPRRDNTYAPIDQTNANSQDSNTQSPRRDNTYAQPDQDHPNSILNEHHNTTHDIIYADPDQNEQNPQDHPRIPNQGDGYANTDPDQANSHHSTTPNIHGHEVMPDLMPRYAHVSKPKKQTSDSLDDNTPHRYVNVQISDNSSEPLLATSESGWMENTLYASSKDRDGGQQAKTSDVTMATATEQIDTATRYSEGWMDNSLYDTSEEYNGSKQNTQEAQEGWVDNSIYDI